MFLPQAAIEGVAGAHAAELASLRAAQAQALVARAAEHERHLVELREEHASQLAAAAVASMPAADQLFIVSGSQTQGGAGTAAAGAQTDPPSEAGGGVAAMAELQAEHERHVDELGVQFTQVWFRV